MAKFNPLDPQYDSGGALPSEGPHIFNINSAECQVSQKSGNPMICCEFGVVGPDGDSGRTAKWQYYPIQESTYWKLAALCRAVNPSMGEFDPENQNDVSRVLVNKAFVGVVAHETSTYQGETRTKVKLTEHRALSAAERKAIGTAAPTAEPVADEDIPF
jgi:ABC-type phosphate transport system substrate-binding protein